MDDPLPTILVAVSSQLPASFFILNAIILVVLLALSGLISGSEVAFFSLPTDRGEKEHNADYRIDRLLQNPRKLLATILIVNNLVNILIVTISTFATWQVTGGKNAGGIIILILTATITLVIVFFGEIMPKVYASHNALGFARFTAGLLQFFEKTLTPLSWLLMSVSDVIEKRIEKKGYNLSVDELNQALEITVDRETTEEEKGILKGIVNFGTLSVKQVMKSRMDITAIDVESDFHELMDQINKTGYSRIPVYSETIDKIEGILYIKDVLPHLDKEETFKWQTLLRPGYFVPESKKIDDLFKDFQEKQVHMAIVVDEYGGTEGLVTLEDIIEEIVGEINDEFDEESDVSYNKLDEHTYIFEGKTSLNDFCKIVDVDTQFFDQVKGESESLGGLLLEINEKLPNAGAKIRFENFLFTIVAVDQKRIKRVRVFIENKVNVAQS
ncbi:MAG: gliding motility-associated protein GldE [Cyclobacteriaceae bacterium]|nr:gliding motility-associated protein GldE [Cyclobacteriaceae bacterium HetDA_MAG_MS6]